MAGEVEESTETNNENPENPDEDQEDDKEDDEDAEGDDEMLQDPEWQEETAVQVFVDRDL